MREGNKYMVEFILYLVGILDISLYMTYSLDLVLLI